MAKKSKTGGSDWAAFKKWLGVVFGPSYREPEKRRKTTAKKTTRKPTRRKKK
jgi:hypothetical protein